ncbi:MAG TPA: hypothetical protein VKJ77_02670, partial [Caballeronia sp.]|nr:hypothetical protein [Caballeronia sp.]
MKTYIRREGWRVALVLDDPEVVPRERGILAAMNCLEGTGCWRLVDLRLSQYRKPSRYSGDMSADVYHANIKPDSEREAVLVKSMLREYREDEDGTIRWCSFDGLVRGHPEVDGYRPVSYANFDQAGYFAYAEAFAQLEEIKRWWDVYEGDPAHARIENGHRQVAEGTV